MNLNNRAAASFEDPLDSVLQDMAASTQNLKRNDRRMSHKPHEPNAQLALLRVSIPETHSSTNCTSTQSASQVRTMLDRGSMDDMGGEGDDNFDDPLAAILDEVESSQCTESQYSNG